MEVLNLDFSVHLVILYIRDNIVSNLDSVESIQSKSKVRSVLLYTYLENTYDM